MRRTAAVIALIGTLALTMSLSSPGSAETRLSGSDNVATAIAWSGQTFDTASVAVLARSDSFADALAAGALAGQLDGPFLVTSSSSLDTRVITELDRLDVDVVYVVGGTAAVSDGVASSLQSRGYEVRRLAGANRIETAVDVAEVFSAPTSVVLARAFGDGTAGFADALGGGALATSMGAPLLLTETGSLSSSTRAYLDQVGVDRAVVVGGTAAVADAVLTEMRGLGMTVSRIAGANRYATAAAIAEEAHDGGDLALLDGLSANAWVSGFAASTIDGGAILLTAGSTIPDETAAALSSLSAAPLVCAPEVSSSVCSAADTAMNGDDLVLADGRMRLAAEDIGDEDLTELPVGDDHVSRTAASVGDLFLCSTFPTDGGGSMTEGPWMNGSTWDLTEKVWVEGEVSWAAAEADVTVVGDERVLSGNLLPVGHTTGEFPIADDDPAAQYDQNPSGIVENDYEIRLPATPTANTTEQCVGGEVGFLLSGVVINSPVDAMGRDALAHELQDHCLGHPNSAGYHYHSVSTCIDDGEGATHSELVGYALDGFGIYGTRGQSGVVMTNADLDECHGHVHAISWDGETVSLYHYHATWQFPYAVGCFRGTSAVDGPVLGEQHTTTGGTNPPPRR